MELVEYIAPLLTPCSYSFLATAPFIPSYCRELASQSIIVNSQHDSPKDSSHGSFGYYILQENVPAEDLPGFSTPIMEFYFRAGASVGLCEVDRGG